MPRDAEKARERSRRHRAKKHIQKFGEGAGNMRGRHGNHARASANGRWNDGRMLSDHGYVLVRVGKDHPLAFGGGYAYEHLVVWLAAGRPMPEPDELIHHINEVKTDNRIENLELKTRSGHGAHHIAERKRDSIGRFVPVSKTEPAHA